MSSSGHAPACIAHGFCNFYKGAAFLGPPQTTTQPTKAKLGECSKGHPCGIWVNTIEGLGRMTAKKRNHEMELLKGRVL